MTEQPFEREQRVSPLELFFDLVFVFAFTQVTTVLANNSTWSGLEHALLLLVAL
jgi:low temperature requirement protein LtrA